MFKFIGKSDLPNEVKKAVTLIVSYALLVALSAIWYSYQTDFIHTNEFFRGMFRVIGILLLAWWVMSLSKKALWSAIAVFIILSVLSIIGVAAFAYGEAYDKLPKLIILAYVLTYTTYSLSKSTTRRYFI